MKNRDPNVTPGIMRPTDETVEEWIADEDQTGWTDMVRELRRARSSEAGLWRALKLYQGRRKVTKATKR